MKTKEEEIEYFKKKLEPYITAVMDEFEQEELEYKNAIRRKKLYDAYKNGLVPYFK